MKKYFFTLILQIFIYHFHYGQILECPPVEFENFKYDWYHIPKDSSISDTTCTWSTGSTHFYQFYQHHIEHEGFLYTVYPVFIFYGEIEGYLLEKIDINTGQLVWQSTLDLRNNDHQEMPAFLKISENNTIDVYSYRRILPNGQFLYFGFTNGETDPCILSKRSYSLSNGSLISIFFPDQNLSTTKIIYRPSRGSIKDIWPLNDTSYLYLSRDKKIKIDYIHLYSGKILSSYQDTITMPKPYDETTRSIQSYRKMKIVSPDTIILLKYIRPFLFDTLDHQATIDIYDRQLRKVNSLNIENLVGHYVDIFMYDADERYIYLIVERQNSQTDKKPVEYLIFDYEGNLISNPLMQHEGKNISFSQIYPKQEFGSFLIVGKLDSNNSLSFFQLSNLNLLTKVTEVKILQDWSLTSSYTFALSAGDILLNGASGTFDGLTFYTSCQYNLIKLSYEKLGLSSIFDKNISSYQVNSYPNPSTGMLTIDLRHLSDKSTIRIFDINGRNVYVEYDITPSEASINLSSLQPAQYVYKVYQGSRQVAVGQWIKL